MHACAFTFPYGACHRFIRVLDCEDKICEFNQEACRINSYNGKKSLVRSFPSKVGARTSNSRTTNHHQTTLPLASLVRDKGWVVRDPVLSCSVPLFPVLALLAHPRARALARSYVNKANRETVSYNKDAAARKARYYSE